MKALIPACAAILTIFNGCCLHKIQFEPFRKLTLEQQISQYQYGARSNCLIGEGGTSIYLAAIASHGLAAADAMTGLLKKPDPDFPLEDAILVLHMVHTRGTNLRNHECVKLLANLAQTSSDPYVREDAKETLDSINCLHKIELGLFRTLTLDEQIRQYKEGIRSNCVVRHWSFVYLDAIASHGMAAADAMAELLKRPDPDFLPEDVIQVLHHVYASGVNLRDHESVKLLADLAETSPEPLVRRRAKETLALIKK